MEPNPSLLTKPAAIRNETTLISVIVPVYNTQSYLHDCIESILHQTYPYLEIILVDDGSTDECTRICDDYAARDARVRVIHQQNAGVAQARNAGTQQAGGEYIVYVDSDDTIAPFMIEELYDALMQARADVSICSIGRQVASHTRRPLRDRSYTGAQAMQVMLYQKQFETGPCGKLFRRALMLQHPFPPGRIFEDLFIMYRVLYDANVVVYRPKKLYYYRNSPHSIMNQPFHRGVLDELEAADEILDFVQENCPHCLPAARARKYSAYCQVFRWVKKRGGSAAMPEVTRRIWAYLVQCRREIVGDRNARLKNRCAAICTLFGERLFARL